MEKELQAFSQELAHSMGNTEQRVYQELSQIEKNCLDYSKDNVDRFVNCMTDSTKRIEKEEKKFEFRMAFLQNNIYSCFKNAEQNSSSYDPCKQQARNDVKRYLDDFIYSVRK